MQQGQIEGKGEDVKPANVLEGRFGNIKDGHGER